MDDYFNYPGDIAAALRALADDFDALPATERLPETAVAVNVQVCRHGGSSAERVTAVDLLTFALLAQDAKTERLTNGEYHHGVDYQGSRRGDGLRVDVFTVVPAPVVAVAA